MKIGLKIDKVETLVGSFEGVDLNLEVSTNEMIRVLGFASEVLSDLTSCINCDDCKEDDIDLKELVKSINVSEECKNNNECNDDSQDCEGYTDLEVILKAINNVLIENLEKCEDEEDDEEFDYDNLLDTIRKVVDEYKEDSAKETSSDNPLGVKIIGIKSRKR